MELTSNSVFIITLEFNHIDISIKILTADDDDEVSVPERYVRYTQNTKDVRRETANKIVIFSF